LKYMPTTIIDPLAFRGLNSLTSLTLEDARLPTFPAEALSQLTKLVQLGVPSNRITNFPRNAFSKFSSLTNLNLDGNNFDSDSALVALENLPKSISVLYLTYCKLTTVPTRVFQPDSQLKYLFMGGNKITKINRDDLKLASDFLVVELIGNPIENIEAGSFQTLRRVKRLELDEAKLTTFDLSLLNGMQDLQKLSLKLNSQLKSVIVTSADQVPLNISVIDISDTGLSTISPELEKIVSRKGFLNLNISYAKKINCNQDVHWVAKYVQCSGRRRIYTDGTKCDGGEYFQDYLKKAVPNACE